MDHDQGVDVTLLTRPWAHEAKAEAEAEAEAEASHHEAEATN